MSNLIDARDIRTVTRKIAKKKFDELITLSTAEPEPIRARLLDEGAVTFADGSIDFYIAKGTLEKYLGNLSDDYVGTINFGHMDFATFPILLGTWTKKDLHLVDIGDGRHALDVDVRLDQKISLVRDLSLQDYSVGLSAEFTYHTNEEASNEIGVPILDEIFIQDFAIVGECGNVNSSDEINLKGGNPIMFDKLKKTEVVEEIIELEAETEEAVDDEIEKEIIEDEVVEEAIEEADESDEAEEAEGEEEDKLTEALEVIANLQQENKELREELSEIKESLSVYEENSKKFEAKFKELTVDFVKPEKEDVIVEQRYVSNDGIGEF